MKITFKSGDPMGTSSDGLVVPVASTGDGPDLSGAVAAVNESLDGELTQLVSDASFGGAVGKTMVIPTLGRLPFRRIVLTGIGTAAEATEEDIRKAWGAAITAATNAGARELTSLLPPNATLLSAAVAGSMMSDHRFQRYFGESRRAADGHPEVNLSFVDASAAAAHSRTQIAQGAALASGVTLARDLCSEPASTLNPLAVAELAAKIAKEEKLEITIFDEAGLAQLGANAILTVGKASNSPPRLIHLVYRPKRKAIGQPIGLAGKCITFDTGGYNIKPGDGMLEMKGDMAGGAAVLGAMSALRKLGCQREVHAVICAAENMISGEAFRPGDVITGMNGVTMEIISTDAEGRLVLADGLVYLSRQGVSEMIDLATLTGAKVVALGDETTALFANDDRLADELLAASERAGESMWRMPLSKHLHQQIKGEVADLKNSGGRSGGAITAALFIEHFSEGLPWAHLDIAGGNRTSKTRPYTPKGSTGVGVRTLLEYLLAAPVV